MKRATKKVKPVEVEAVAEPVTEVAPEPEKPVKHTRIILFATPHTNEMIDATENLIDDSVADGFEVVACVPYGVDHMVILLKRTAA